LAQTANGKPVGSYRTVVDFLPDRKIAFVADRRTGAIFDARKNPAVFKAIPYADLVPFTSPDLAVQEGFRFAKADTRLFLSGKLGGQIANVHREFHAEHVDDVIGTMPGGMAATVVGRVVDRHGTGVAGVRVLLDIPSIGLKIDDGVTDPLGYYVIRVPVKVTRVFAPGKKAKIVSLSLVTKEGLRGTAARKCGSGDDLHFAAAPIVLGR
jgi:hypothetical protein